MTTMILTRRRGPYSGPVAVPDYRRIEEQDNKRHSSRWQRRRETPYMRAIEQLPTSIATCHGQVRRPKCQS